MFPRLGCAAVLCGACGPSPVPLACPLLGGGPFSTLVVVCPCTSRETRRPRWGVVWGSLWVVFPPTPFFFGTCGCWVRPSRWRPFVDCGGGGVCGCGSRFFSCCGPLVVGVACSGCVSLAPCPPPSFFCLAAGPCCVRVPVTGGLPLRRRGSLPACPRCIFLWPVGGCLAVVVCFCWLGVVGLGGVVSRCPIRGSRGRRPWCRLAGMGGCPPRWSSSVAWRLCGCLSCLPQLPLAGGCALVGWIGLYGCFLLVGGWNFRPSLSFLFWEGGCLFLPLPSLGWRMHWLANGVAKRLVVCVAACRCVVGDLGRCPGSVRLVAYVNAWADGPSCRVRLGLCRLGRCASRFCGVRGRGGRGMAEALLWGGVAWCPPAPVLLVRCWRVYLCGGGLCRRTAAGGGWGLCPGFLVTPMGFCTDGRVVDAVPWHVWFSGFGR